MHNYYPSYIYLVPFFIWMSFANLNGQEVIETLESEYSCELDDCEPSFPLPNKFSVGPEIYHVKRTRHGGVELKGRLYGVRATYERIKRCRLYWGIDFLYASGTLRGKNIFDESLKTRMRDENIEGRLGYTFQLKTDWQPAIIPYIGYGYFWETNKFLPPSELQVRLKNTYQYVAYGFLTSIAPRPDLNIGFNFKGRYLIDPRCRVTEDPLFDPVTLDIEEKFNYRLELPLSYRYLPCNPNFEIGVVPFFEYRHYGERAGFPYDFTDTKFKIYGINIQLTYRM